MDEIKDKTEKTVTIPVAWFQRLLEHAEKTDAACRDQNMTVQLSIDLHLPVLMGYISSATQIIKHL